MIQCVQKTCQKSLVSLRLAKNDVNDFFICNPIIMVDIQSPGFMGNMCSIETEITSYETHYGGS